MPYTTTWKTTFCEFDVEPDNKQKVTILHWDCVVTDDATEEFRRAYGTVNAADQNRVYAAPALGAVPSSVMTPWVLEALGDEAAEIESALTIELDEYFVPTSGGFTVAE